MRKKLRMEVLTAVGFVGIAAQAELVAERFPREPGQRIILICF